MVPGVGATLTGGGELVGAGVGGCVGLVVGAGAGLLVGLAVVLDVGLGEAVGAGAPADGGVAAGADVGSPLPPPQPVNNIKPVAKIAHIGLLNVVRISAPYRFAGKDST